ncbi:MAG TPA: cation diffusion facilitator family transporter [Burkholderiales bacterium]|nr:cation diffusion facilitator family transporter [Burkholderiales bacterium]
MAHGHVHSHAQLPKRRDFGRNFAIATALNVALVIAQVIYGFLANSLALLADAGHNFGDVIGLVLAWGAFALSGWKPSRGYTFRFQGASILAAFANGLILVVATGAIAWEAVRRFWEPQEVATGTVMALALLGVVVNGISALFLHAGRKSDLNVQGAFVHMVADAGMSLAVLAAAAGIYFTGWQWLDPVAGLAIAAVILGGTWSLLRESFRLSLNAAPSAIDPAAVQHFLESRAEVRSVHDLHIWAMSTTATAMSCHIVTTGHPGNAFLHDVAHELEHRFNISHPTIQIELADAGRCPVEHDHAA